MSRVILGYDSQGNPIQAVLETEAALAATGMIELMPPPPQPAEEEEEEEGRKTPGRGKKRKRGGDGEAEEDEEDGKRGKRGKKKKKGKGDDDEEEDEPKKKRKVRIISWPFTMEQGKSSNFSMGAAPPFTYTCALIQRKVKGDIIQIRSFLLSMKFRKFTDLLLHSG